MKYVKHSLVLSSRDHIAVLNPIVPGLILVVDLHYVLSKGSPEVGIQPCFWDSVGRISFGLGGTAKSEDPERL